MLRCNMIIVFTGIGAHMVALRKWNYGLWIRESTRGGRALATDS
jgi:hypothetical protein